MHAAQASSDRDAAIVGSLIVWGWKDPRTTLFLDFWSPLLPSLGRGPSKAA